MSDAMEWFFIAMGIGFGGFLVYLIPKIGGDYYVMLDPPKLPVPPKVKKKKEVKRKIGLINSKE